MNYLVMIQHTILKIYFYLLTFKLDPCKVFYSSPACKSDRQSLGVFACSPALPVGSNEGRVRDQGLRHLD